MTANDNCNYLSFFNPEKRLLQAEAEKESIEADLSSMFPKVGRLLFTFLFGNLLNMNWEGN